MHTYEGCWASIFHKSAMNILSSLANSQSELEKFINFVKLKSVVIKQLFFAKKTLVM